MSAFGNPFTALASCEERDPKKLLKQGKQQASKQRTCCKQPRQQMPASSSNQQQLAVRTQTEGHTTAETAPDSPGLAEALAAIELFEQAGKGQWDAVTSSGSVIDWGTPAPAASSSEQSPHQPYYAASNMDDMIDDNSWYMPPQCQGPQQQQQLVGQQPQQQQQQQHKVQSNCSYIPYSNPAELSPAAPSAAVLDTLNSKESLWQQFACAYAADASAAGQHDQAASAADFSEQIAAGLLLSDAATAAVLAAAVEEAQDAGLLPMEVIAAQQKALLFEAEAAAAAAAGQGCSTQKQSWAKLAAKQPRSQLPEPDSSFVSPQPKKQLRAAAAGTNMVEPQTDFPALASSSHTGFLSPRASPCSASRGGRGGSSTSTPQTSGIRVINSSKSNSSTLRPSKLDLHWDLKLDGLRPKEDAELGLELLCALSDAEASEATRLLVEQQAAEVERADGESSCLSQARLRSMMDRAAKAAATAQGADQGTGSDGHPEEEVAGSRHCGRDFRHMWDHMYSTGWVPVSKRQGGGGSHFKFRRVLPVSGIVQTLVHASSPSDSQRGERNAAAAIARLDKQAKEIENAARAAAAAAGRGAGNSTAARPCSGIKGK